MKLYKKKTIGGYEKFIAIFVNRKWWCFEENMWCSKSFNLQKSFY